jgi:hypothetical protein
MTKECDDFTTMGSLDIPRGKFSYGTHCSSSRGDGALTTPNATGQYVLVLVCAGYGIDPTLLVPFLLGTLDMSRRKLSIISRIKAQQSTGTRVRCHYGLH